MEIKVPCGKCGAFILPQTFLKCDGVCMKCYSFQEEYTPSDKVHEKLKAYKDELIPVMAAEISNDIRDLYESKVNFYGYSIRPSCIYRSNTIDIASVYNSLSDIEPQNRESLYYKYCVSEWENFRHNGFEGTNVRLKNYLQEYIDVVKSENNIDDEDRTDLFADMANMAIIAALKIVKESGLLKQENVFLILWYPDSQYEVVIESAKQLNLEQVYQEFASEFA